jgi:hypothetical protein
MPFRFSRLSLIKQIRIHGERRSKDLILLISQKQQAW